MEINTKTSMTITIELTEAEARAAVADGSALRKAIQRELLPDGAPVVARRKKMPRRKPAPKVSKTMTCPVCHKVYKRPNLYRRHVIKHSTAQPAAES